MSTALTRRGALKLLGGLALAALPGAGLVERAAAGRSWCRTDPLFLIGEYAFDIRISSDVSMLSQASGPVQVDLQVPPGMPVSLLFDDRGFGYGYAYTSSANSKLNVNKNSFKVIATVTAPAADGTLPVEVTVTLLSRKALLTQNTVTGYANEPVVWSGKVDKVLTPNAMVLLG